MKNFNKFRLSLAQLLEIVLTKDHILALLWTYDWLLEGYRVKFKNSLYTIISVELNLFFFFVEH